MKLLSPEKKYKTKRRDVTMVFKYTGKRYKVRKIFYVSHEKGA